MMSNFFLNFHGIYNAVLFERLHITLIHSVLGIAYLNFYNGWSKAVTFVPLLTSIVPCVQVRFYWSMRVNNKRCRYICSIHEANGRPEFRVLIQEPAQEDMELRDTSARAVWVRVLEPLVTLRKANNSVQVFPRYVSGEDLFGLTEPAIVRVLESMPGKLYWNYWISQLAHTNYKF